MSQSTDDLQFDEAQPTEPVQRDGPSCARCGTPIEVYYYEAEGQTVCRRCKARDEAAHGTASAGRGMLGAAVLGALGALLGAAIYLGVAWGTGYEVGLIAILVGFIVGKAVFVGSGRTGGRRYQVLAVVLTYLAISVTYVPQMMMQMVEEGEQRAAAADSAATVPPDSTSIVPLDTAAAAEVAAADSAYLASLRDSLAAAGFADSTMVGGVELASPLGVTTIAGVVGLMLLLAPVRVVMADFPGSLLSIVIIGVGLLQAWQGTRRQRVEYKGPFKLAGAGPAAAERTTA